MRMAISEKDTPKVLLVSTECDRDNESLEVFRTG